MKGYNVYIKLSGIAALSITFVVVLFLLSENRVHRNNDFTRRYPHHPIVKKYDLPIKYNSYYLAGFDQNILYLGNTTAPLHVLRIDLSTKDTVHIRIKLAGTDLPFRAVNVRVRPPYFFVMDGTVPFIFRGLITDWKADVWMQDKAYFSRAIPIDSNRIYINTISSKTQLSTLGVIEKQQDFKVVLNPDILEKQIDGIFDVDGTMTVSPNGQDLGYVYFYRNQFMVMNSDLELLKRQRTIDTVQKAQIKLAQLANTETTKMKAPPLLVNKMAAIYKDLLLIGSDRLGKNEERSMLKEASIIDVYNWKKDSYEFSFYLYHIQKEKASEFGIYGDYLMALIDDVLSVYELREQVFNKSMANKNTEKINFSVLHNLILSADSGKEIENP